MQGYQQFLLKDMLDELGEDDVKHILSQYQCPLNLDVENFFKNSAIEFAKQTTAPTHLVFASYKSRLVLVGYYTLTLKNMYVSKKAVTKNLGKRLSKFSIRDQDVKGYRIAAPLIAQLGKNFANGYNTLISGGELLLIACDKVRETQRIIGGKIVYIECEDKPSLLNFYCNNGFVNFGKRSLDKDEKDVMSGDYLCQMLKYL